MPNQFSFLKVSFVDENLLPVCFNFFCELIVTLHFYSTLTLARFYFCSPLHISNFHNFFYIIFHFHIEYIPSSSWSFLRFFFNVLFRLPQVFFSNQLPVVFPLRVSYRIFLFVTSYFTRIIYTKYHIPSFPLLTVSLLPFSNFFTDSCMIFPIRCHLFYSCFVHQLLNSQFPPCLFICFFFFSFHRSFPLSLSIVSEFPYRLSSLSIPKCNLFQILLQFQSHFYFIFYLDYFRLLFQVYCITALRFQTTCDLIHSAQKV